MATQVEQVQRQISRLRKELLGRQYLFHDEITELVDQYFKRFGAKAELYTANKKKDFISVGGEYLIGRKRLPIKLQIAVSERSDRIRLTKKTLEAFMFLLFQILLHELRHKYQYLFRDADSYLSYYLTLDDANDDMTEDQLYLAELDEIDAYAGDIALELFHHCRNNWREEMANITCKQIQSYHYYCEAFKGTDWFDIRKHLLKKVYKHAMEIEATKGWYKNA